MNRADSDLVLQSKSGSPLGIEVYIFAANARLIEAAEVAAATDRNAQAEKIASVIRRFLETDKCREKLVDHDRESYLLHADLFAVRRASEILQHPYIVESLLFEAASLVNQALTLAKRVSRGNYAAKTKSLASELSKTWLPQAEAEIVQLTKQR